MYANLFGDFVKGSDLQAYSPEIQYGIRLHRKIDHYIDHHPKVQALMHELHEELPRISGIAVDLYFDHLLARHWSEYHSQELEEFVTQFFAYPVDRSAYPKEEFWLVLDTMRDGNWIVNYRHHHGLEFACRGLSRRISFPNALYTAPEVFLIHEKKIEQCFRLYMKDAQDFFAATDT